MEDKIIVVTGGAGFIGSGIIRHLNDRGISNIVVVDELEESEKWKNLVGKSFDDIVSKYYLFDWLEGREDEIGAFIHMGACSDTTETDADYLLENNYHYTVDLAEYAIENDIRFIYASSAATYGDGEKGFSDDHEGLLGLEPLNMYGYSKHLFDLWAQKQGVLDKVVGLKYFNVFGPNEGHKGRMASVIPSFVKKGLKDGKICLFKSSEPEKYSDGGQKRDFVYVKDVARITCSFLNNTECGIFNVGSGIAHTWNSLAHSIVSAVDFDVKIEYIDMPKDLIGKYQNYTRADIEKLQGVDDNTMTPLKDAVEDYIKNYLLVDKLW